METTDTPFNSTISLTTTDKPNGTEDTWVVVLEFILGVVGIVGNTLVCIIIVRATFLHNLTNYLILSLAFADLLASLFLILNVFVLEAKIITGPPEGKIAAEIFCRLYYSRHFFWVCVTASVFNLVCVTFERFFAIVYPLHYPKYFNFRKVVTMVIIVWVIANVQELFAVFVNHYSQSGHTCEDGASDGFSKFIGTFVFVISYFLPLLSMILAYFLIYENLKKGSSMGDLSHTQEQANSMTRARRRVVQVLFTVVMAYVILWTPNQVVYLLENYDITVFGITKHTALYKFFRLLAFTNSVINPFIYAFKYKQFRKGFRVAILGAVCKNMVTDAMNNDSSESYHRNA